MNNTNTPVSEAANHWTPVALSAPEPCKIWLCDSFYDERFASADAVITHRAPSGSVQLDFNGRAHLPGVFTRGRWVLTNSRPLARRLGLTFFAV